MTLWYIDTSAATKLLVSEAESEHLAEELDTSQPDLVACYLLESELRRVVHRVESLNQVAATTVLDSVALYEVPPSLLREAGVLPGPTLRTLDALHLAAAVRLGVDAVLTYDSRMTDAARAIGLAVVSPGATAC